jgi:hypothetical protein
MLVDFFKTQSVVIGLDDTIEYIFSVFPYPPGSAGELSFADDTDITVSNTYMRAVMVVALL